MVAYLGLGSNLGDRERTVEAAIAALGSLGSVKSHSALYETDPEGGADQPKYINAVVRLDTEHSALALLQACLAIEDRHGRKREAGKPKAARTLDIDLLLYGAEVIDQPGLSVPHPSLLARPFVRIPLAEVALPGLRHPRTGDLLDRAGPDRTVRRLG
jgi:2-amino-4-hydroxy-6-hydroxymethyldihydropteridine diphosphokinase